MSQTLLAGAILQQTRRGFIRRLLTTIDGADLRVFHNGFDGRNGALRVVLIDGGDKDVAVLLNVDLAVEVAHLLNDIPPLPMTSPVLSAGIIMLNLKGGQLGARLGGRPVVSSRMYRQPLRHFSQRFSTMLVVRPSTLISIWMAVMPRRVPPTLKSCRRGVLDTLNVSIVIQRPPCSRVCQ